MNYLVDVLWAHDSNNTAVERVILILITLITHFKLLYIWNFAFNKPRNDHDIEGCTGFWRNRAMREVTEKNQKSCVIANWRALLWTERVRAKNINKIICVIVVFLILTLIGRGKFDQTIRLLVYKMRNVQRLHALHSLIRRHRRKKIFGMEQAGTGGMYVSCLLVIVFFFFRRICPTIVVCW